MHKTDLPKKRILGLLRYYRSQRDYAGPKPVYGEHIVEVLPIVVSCYIQLTLIASHKFEFHYRFLCFVNMHTEET